MNSNGQAQEPPQKLIDFNEELKALCDKYQYELRSVMQFDPLQGLFCVLQAYDVSPKVEGVKLTPEAEVVDEGAKKNEDSQNTLETSNEENTETVVDNSTEN